MITKLAGDIYGRVSKMLRLSLSSLPSDESKAIQYVQVGTSALEGPRTIQSMQLQGFASGLLANTSVIYLALAGDQARAIGIASNNAAIRPKGLAPGEAQMYDHKGQRVYLQGGTKVVIDATTHLIATAKADIALDTPVVKCSGNLTVGSGATGVFTSADGKTITVKSGIITEIKPL